MPHPLDALLARRRWIGWQLEDRGGSKPAKVPVSLLTGRPHSAFDPAHQQDYAAAHAWHARTGGRLGFAFHRDDGLVFLDIDNALLSSGQWHPLALDMLGRFPNAAWEVSQSGRGLHMFCSGRLPDRFLNKYKGTDGCDLELYNHDRYCAVTFDRLQGDAGVDYTDALAGLVASHFAPRITDREAGPAPLLVEMDPFRLAVATADLTSALDSLDADDYHQWHNVGENLRCLGDVGWQLWDAWSRRSSKYDSDRAEQEWNRMQGTRSDYRAVFAKAQAAGWVNPAARVTTTTPGATAEATIAALAPLPNAALAEQWLAAVPEMPREEANKVAAYVAHRTQVPAPTLTAQVRVLQDSITVAENTRKVADEAAGRVQLLLRPDAPHIMALEIEAALLERGAAGSYVNFGGVPSQIVVRPLPQGLPGSAEVAQVEPLGAADLLKQAGHACAFYKAGKLGPLAVVHPKEALDILLHQKSGGRAPSITGVLTHPTVRLDGTILNAPGHDRATGLFGTAGVALECRAYLPEEVPAAMQRLLQCCLPGFRFESTLARDSALSGFFLAVVRRVLDIAPAFAALANHQASGKTTLCRGIHLIQGGRDMPVTNLPMRDSEEGEKLIAALLIRNPEMLCFDNVGDGFTVRSGTLTQALTSAVFEARLLGMSRILTCNTNVLISVTGNNLSFGADEQSRFLPVHLLAHDDNYRLDVVNHYLSVRDQVLRDIIGVIAGYLQYNGQPQGQASRFTQWDRMVRFPLIWAGFSDPAESFKLNAERSDDEMALRQIVWSIAQLFPEGVFSVSALISAAVTKAGGAAGTVLHDALEMLGVENWNTAFRRVNHRISAIVRKPIGEFVIDRLPAGEASQAQFKLIRRGV